MKEALAITLIGFLLCVFIAVGVYVGGCHNKEDE